MARTTKSLPVITIASTGSITTVNISKTSSTSSRSSTSSTPIEPTEPSLYVSSAGNKPDTFDTGDGGGQYTDTTTTDDVVISTISNDESTSSAYSDIVIGVTAIDTVVTSATAATTTMEPTPNHSNNNNKSGNHIQPWIIPAVYVTLSLIFVGLAMFCIRRSCSKYRRRRPLLGENNGGSMREISTNGGDGIERFDQLSFNSEMIGDGFNSNNQSLVGSIVDSATEFPAFSGHKQGISHDITDAHADFNDDPFSDVAFAEDTSSFRNASPSPQLSQHSDITEKVEAHEPSKTKTSDFAEVFVESPTSYGGSFNFYADPFQNNEYFLDDEEMEPRPMLKPSLSRIPTVISAYNELIDLTPSVNVTGDDSNNTSSSVNDIRNEIVNASNNELSPFDNLVSVAGTDGRGEGASTEYLRTILLPSTEDLPVTGKDGEADSKSLAEELSTVLTISSAIESTALPILSTYDGGPSENVVTESRDDVGTIEQSHNNTERSRDDILNDHL